MRCMFSNLLLTALGSPASNIATFFELYMFELTGYISDLAPPAPGTFDRLHSVWHHNEHTYDDKSSEKKCSELSITGIIIVRRTETTPTPTPCSFERHE